MIAISIITCSVGVIGCIIGIATYTSAQLSKAKQDGALMEKVDYLVRSFDEQKRDVKERNTLIDNILDEHTREITELKTKIKHLEKEVFDNGGTRLRFPAE